MTIKQLKNLILVTLFFTITVSYAQQKTFGVTIDDPWTNINELTDALSSHSYKPTARIVFDEGVAASEYHDPVTQIASSAFIMGEILDSYYVTDYTVNQYINRTTEYLDAFEDIVSIWEIGNEINGSWVAENKDPNKIGAVVQKIEGAYNIVKERGKETALTLYYNPNADCRHSGLIDFEMFYWVKNNLSNAMKQGLDYVLVSYYEDSCPEATSLSESQWQTVFDELHQLFPNSKLGIGECGTLYQDSNGNDSNELREGRANNSREIEYMNRYYNMNITTPNYIGGYFWWFYKQDCVPKTKELWGTLDSINSSYEEDGIPTYTLPDNSWRMITLPADPGSNNTVKDLFADDIPGKIGTDWAVYYYNSKEEKYVDYGLSASLKPGVGYWIIQTSGADVTLDMPTGSTALTDASFSIWLRSKTDDTTWNMIGNPYASAISMNAVRVQTSAGACTGDCTLDVAESNNIVHNQFWSYNGSEYVTYSGSATLSPWTGYWVVTLEEGEGKNPTIKFFKSSAKLESVADELVVKSANSRNLLEGATSNPGFPVFPVVSDDTAINTLSAMVHPNPSNGLFNFNFSSAYKGAVSITIHNLLGKQIKELKVQKNETDFAQQIDLTKQSTGIYFIQFTAGKYHSNHQVIKK